MSNWTVFCPVRTQFEENRGSEIVIEEYKEQQVRKQGREKTYKIEHKIQTSNEACLTLISKVPNWSTISWILHATKSYLKAGNRGKGTQKLNLNLKISMLSYI